MLQKNSKVMEKIVEELLEYEILSGKVNFSCLYLFVKRDFVYILVHFP